MLKRGNITETRSVILLADSSGGHAFSDADQRTIIAAFAIKNLAGDLKVSAELNKKENEEHLKRACVDDILIYGEFGGFLLSHSALSQGVPSLLMELLTFSVGNTVAKKEIPDSYVGKTFPELLKHYHDKHRALLTGLLSEEKSFTSDDILRNEEGGIDLFIKRKFQEVEEDYFANEKPRFKMRLNPGDNYIIQKIDTAFVITRDF